MNRLARRLILLCTALLAGLSGAQTQIIPSRPGNDGEFYFARLIYRSNSCRTRGGGWQTDLPDAEEHLLPGINRLTRVANAAEGVFVDLESDDIMRYPWVYAVEVGQWLLDDREAAKLREYLLRGGFLMVDDFWGTRQWACFYDSMQRVFPDRLVVDLDEEHELMNVLYDLDFSIQIPGVGYTRSGQTWEEDGYVPQWRGIHDDEGRLMVAINFNMDLGDAWEHADNPQYPEAMTGLAYRFAMNYLIYSMTH